MDIEAYNEHAAAIWTNDIWLGSEEANADYRVIAVHLEWNLIFLVGEDRTLMAYGMSHRKVYVLPT